MKRLLRSILGLLGLAFVLVVLRVGYGVITSATSHSEPDLSRGLIGYWSFDDTDMSGNIAFDRSGQGHNGTLMNGAHTAAGKIGQAIEFDGRTSYLDTGSDFVSTKAMTISAWVYAHSYGESGQGRILDNGSTILKVPNVDHLAFSSDGQVTTAHSEFGSFPPNGWIHVVVTRTSTGAATFYINSLVSGTANQSSGTPAAGTANVLIGGDSAHAWDGFIDDVRIYNRVLSPDEIKQLYTRY
jgi:hypothetical protein